MILIVTHSKDLSADLVIRHLRAKSADFLRLDTDRLGTQSCHFGFSDGPRLTVDGRTFTRCDFSAIWARRFARPTHHADLDPKYRDFVRRENSVVMDAFLETANCYQMNPYLADRLAGNRLIQSERAASVGLSVPVSCATQDVAEAKAFLDQHPRAIIKALSFGRLTDTVDDVAARVAYTAPVSTDTDWSGLAVGPVLLQERVEARYEWRITTVGKTVFAARTPFTGEVDWRNSTTAPIFERAAMPSFLEEKLLGLCQKSGIVYGAHDLIETADGDFVLLETNPAGQWGWLEAELALPIGEAIADELMAHHG